MVLGQFVRDPTLSDFPFLSSLASSESPKDRRIWLRVATDHFVATEPSDSDTVEEYIKAMTAQLDAADSAARLEVARKLAPCARAPARLLAALSSADSEACDYALEHAVAYANSELERAVSRSVRSAIAIAKRRCLDPQIVSTLAAQDDILVLVALASNESARLEGPTLLDLLRRARRLAEQEGDRRLADALLQRAPVRRESAVLFLCARPNQRIEILLAAQRSQLGRPTAPSVPMRSTSLDELELAAVSRQPERFVALLAEALDCKRELAQKIVDDATGEPLAVALAALGAANEVLVRILISNDLLAGASYQRIRALARLNNALDRNAAMMVMAALRDEPAARATRKPSIEAYPVPAPSRATPASITKRAGDSPQRMLRK
ncbi:MAG TPA: hypothetical protein VJY34_20770 [Roseiarcus sp.]|nr:hypothetical protein [Roseiarcus sp.]